MLCWLDVHDRFEIPLEMDNLYLVLKVRSGWWRVFSALNLHVQHASITAVCITRGGKRVDLLIFWLFFSTQLLLLLGTP